jgi:hypothetical protein
MPNLLELAKEDLPIKADERLKKLWESWEKARSNLEKAQKKLKKCADRKRREMGEGEFMERKRV